MNTSRAFVDVEIKGENITADISGDVMRFSYNDHAGAQCDDYSLTIQNRDGRWMKAWMPKEGDTINARIITKNWTNTIDCGTAIIDDLSFSGWPMTVEIKALAMPMNTDFSDVEKNRTWSESTLKSIAQSIADENGLTLSYRAANNPTLSFISQTEKSDKTFLHDLCEKYGLTMKPYSGGLVIFDRVELESKKADITLTPREMASFSAHSTITNTGYGACTVRYTTKDGKTLEYTTPTTGKTEKVYRHDTVVDTLEEAKLVAAAKLREKNFGETTFSCTTAGDTGLMSGICINIKGFGSFDGKYFIDSAAHNLGGGYEVSLDCHKAK